jgi:glutamate-1-semialdehyde 2,1-aminomutase
MSSHIPGFTSTGSKRPESLYGIAQPDGAPLRMVRASGCTVTGDDGRSYTDFIMALGAVALGYAHPAVTAAVAQAAADGLVGPLAPVLEEQVAAHLCRLLPPAEEVRFLKTGAEAVAAAIRIARAQTGREDVIGCGYHGWLDGTQEDGTCGVPAGISSLFARIPFNDAEAATARIRAAGDKLAAVIVEPVIEAAPSPEWLTALRTETHRVGAVLIFDEIKTVGRVALNGAAGRWGGEPDLVVLGKAIANGMPLAAVAGHRDIMSAVTKTWISSTLATEFASLAAAEATLLELERADVPAHLERVGGMLLHGLHRIVGEFPALLRRAVGLPAMCFLEFTTGDHGRDNVVGCARRGLLFKRSAYNFVSLAHDERAVAGALDVLQSVLRETR